MPKRICYILLLLSISHFCCSVNETFDDQWTAAMAHISAGFQGVEGEKQKGAHIFGRLDSTNIQPFLQNNIEWITLVPFADQKDFDSPTLRYFRGDSIQQGRRDSMWSSQIAVAHAADLKVFLKPHIWLHAPTDGKWRSDIFPTNEANWEAWQKSYREFILHYATLAAQHEVELFCIGTELTRISLEKPDFWRSLIQEVRGIYGGQLTYAANWYAEYENLDFWEDLDYIGIQAYFPLVKTEKPTVEQVSAGWADYLPAIEAMSKQHKRRVLFTEMGYKSTADSAIEPWKWIEYGSQENSPISYATQANCYAAFFNTIWQKEWFAGVHIWQMRCDSRGEGRDSLDFTPSGKPAELVIAKGFE